MHPSPVSPSVAHLPTKRVLLTGLALLGLILSGSSHEAGAGTLPGHPQEPLEGVHTLVATFLFEDVPEDFILARPGLIAVSLDSDLLILDEDYLKVFDSTGRAKQLVGGPGDGPGEFRNVWRIWYSPNGYYTVFGGQFGNIAHYFRPDHSFIERTDFWTTRPFLDFIESRGLIPQRLECIYALTEHERIYALRSRDPDPDHQDDSYVFLFHETPDTLRCLAEYRQTNAIWAGASGIELPFLGTLEFLPLEDRRLVYLHTYHDGGMGEDDPCYTLTFYSLDSGRTTRVRHAYQPVEIDRGTFSLPGEVVRSPDPETTRRMNRDRQSLPHLVAERFEEQKYQTPVSRLIAEGNRLFVFLARPPGENEDEETPLDLVDIYDVNTMQYVVSARLPFGTQIRDGYLYSPQRSSETGYSIRKYRLDPRLWDPITGNCSSIWPAAFCRRR